jgi:ubiquitin C-terminal hydrolase
VHNGIARYQLYGLVCHFGSLENGHYIAYGLRGGEWHEFNDERVSRAPLTDVTQNQAAYLLMY